MSFEQTHRGLLDTSVFIAREQSRPLTGLPRHLALARNADPIPITEAVMITWARLVADCRAAGVHRTVRLTEALIAATAIEHGLPVITQDADYDQISHAHPALQVVKV